MEFNIEEFKQTLESNPDIAAQIVPLVSENEAVTTLVNSRAGVLFEERIGEHNKAQHAKYDEDMFSILGERAGVNEDGSKQKTYEKSKALYQELKDLRTQKGDLNADTRVIDLQAQIQELQKDGGGQFVQDLFDAAKTNWSTKEGELLGQIQSMKDQTLNSQKMTSIKDAFSQIKLNPDTPSSIKDMVLNNVEKELLKNSKIEDGKLVFLDKNGAPELNKDSSEPKTALEMLQGLDTIKQISIKEVKKGGGADSKITGSITTNTVEGKDVKELVIPMPRSQKEFLDVAEATLIAQGITRNDTNFSKLKDAAFVKMEIKGLPITI